MRGLIVVCEDLRQRARRHPDPHLPGAPKTAWPRAVALESGRIAPPRHRPGRASLPLAVVH